ncbi:cytochrome c nitrite reductase pentaheme subunit [Aeromonas caviae]|uniref:cytochrome c nitrite reductase pentaheme subunit n=1 Tax=Aeromonas caviae TaxID=648 RepID=UPI000DDADE7E|nr:cytochrome c nitrite reductase pentaheme subunit [Aeromonas caviae]AXB02315.1 cytochrome c nitrite reductase pentaheme subunit [Aeromonas caviae]QLL80524.1 cytochrome c nitrite reductase pentaheme subunit [Aeromonas caviae]UBS67340.1 cytochrome c nitrite reductase pentaheme subunit [Aeromonas caviae]WKS86621.1 cytochrome c nitrite reductase pentaheme subunit [Aeromonas caviae]BDC86645.1 cytochrome c nitrite reductase pentaheme subunit [Aeromonas caviae]
MGDLTMDFLRLMLMATMLLTSLQGQAADAATAPAPTTHEVEFLRSADKACTDCHKEQVEGMHGNHGQATNPNNLAPVTCTNCHGQPSPQHREGVKDVMRFSDSFKDKQSTERYPIAEQNGVCMSCHEPKVLREALWAHDVHATKLTCTSCHQLHPAKEPMVAIPEKSRIKLCVDCHSKQHEAVKAAKANTTSGKEAP